jgi:hypothetical protein
MAFLEAETLRDRFTQGSAAPRLDEYARTLTKTGAKLMDFGLAKVLEWLPP